MPGSGEFKIGDVPVQAQTEQAMHNMGAVLSAAGASFDNGLLFGNVFKKLISLLMQLELKILYLQ